MFPRPKPASQDRQAYIPPNMQQALAQHAQQAMPAHLKKYQDGRAFIPTHAENAIKQHMQKSVPAHMKEYVGAYVEQNMVFQGGSQPSAAAPHPQGPRPVAMARPPVPQIPRQAGYSRPLGTPSTVELLKSVQSAAPSSPIQPQQFPDPAAPQSTSPPPDIYPQSPTPLPQPQQPQSSQPDYDFIMNSGQPPPSKLKLPGSGGGTNSVAIRIGLVAAGLIVLVIIFSVVRGLLSGDSNKPLFVAVVQDQQELVHLTTGVTSKQDISTSNSNFASTANLSLKTAQQDMITYMTNLGIKGVDPKVLALQVNPKTDKQLADAAVASTYNETFREIMKTELASYKQDLQAAYNKTDGPKGRKLLADQFRQAELLEIQLGETIN